MCSNIYTSMTKYGPYIQFNISSEYEKINHCCHLWGLHNEWAVINNRYTRCSFKQSIDLISSAFVRPEKSLKIVNLGNSKQILRLQLAIKAGNSYHFFDDCSISLMTIASNGKEINYATQEISLLIKNQWTLDIFRDFL